MSSSVTDTFSVSSNGNEIVIGPEVTGLGYNWNSRFWLASATSTDWSSSVKATSQSISGKTSESAPLATATDSEESITPVRQS